MVCLSLPSNFIGEVHDSQHGTQLLSNKLTLKRRLHVILNQENFPDVSVCVCVCVGGGVGVGNGGRNKEGFMHLCGEGGLKTNQQFRC